MLKYLTLFLVALAFSLLLTPGVRSLAKRLGALDVPGERKIHHQPIPRLGGLSIFIAFGLVVMAASQISFFFLPVDFLQKIHFEWMLVASGIVLGLGSIDDFRRMTAGIKFLFQIIAGVIVALTCCKIDVIALPFGTLKLGIFAVPATVLWVVAITNAINLLDGMDGLAAGTCFIVCIAMFGISLLHQNVGIALLAIVLSGSILGFLKYNFHPASIFLGDSGAYFLGFIISVLSLQSGLKGTTTIAILIPIIALGLPIMDTLLSMFRRLLKSLHIMEIDREKNVVKFFYLNGWSMFKADREHIHHRLLEMGFTYKKAVFVLYGISLILGGVAFSSVYFRNINYAILLTAIGIGSYIGIRKLGYREIQVLSNGSLLPLFDSPLVSHRIFEVFVDMAVISISYYVAFLLRFGGSFTPVKDYYLVTLPLVLLIKITIFNFTGLYKGGWQYANIADLIRIIRAVTLGCIASFLLLWLGFGLMSAAALIIDFNLLLFSVLILRSSFRILEYLYNSNNGLQRRKVLIYGVGKNGLNALHEFVSNPSLGLRPIGFVDDDLQNKGKQVNGYPVLGTLDTLNALLEKTPVSDIVVSSENIPKERLDRLSKICLSYHILLRRFQIRLEELTPSPQN